MTPVKPPTCKRCNKPMRAGRVEVGRGNCPAKQLFVCSPCNLVVWKKVAPPT